MSPDRGSGQSVLTIWALKSNNSSQCQAGGEESRLLFIPLLPKHHTVLPPTPGPLIPEDIRHSFDPYLSAGPGCRRRCAAVSTMNHTRLGGEATRTQEIGPSGCHGGGGCCGLAAAIPDRGKGALSPRLCTPASACTLRSACTPGARGIFSPL